MTAAARVCLLAAAVAAVLAQEYLCEAPVDMAFVMDASGSIGGSDYQLMRDFATGIAEKMLIAEDAVWMSVVQFGTDALTSIPLSYDADRLLTFLPDVSTRQGGSATNISGGLAQALTQFALYGRPNRAKFALLMSDGGWNREHDPTRIANLMRAKEMGVTILVVAIGTLDPDLPTFASHPTDQFYIHVDTFAELEERLEEILEKACIPCPLTCCGHGFCNPNGSPPCVCEQGYVGDDCCNTSPDWLVPLAAATTGVVFLAALAALFLGAMKHGTGALPVPVEEIEVEDAQLEEIEIEPMEEEPMAAEMDLDTDTGAIGAGVTGMSRPMFGPASRVAPSTFNTARRANEPGEGVKVGEKRVYSPFDLPKRF